MSLRESARARRASPGGVVFEGTVWPVPRLLSSDRKVFCVSCAGQASGHVNRIVPILRVQEAKRVTPKPYTIDIRTYQLAAIIAVQEKSGDHAWLVGIRLRILGERQVNRFFRLESHRWAPMARKAPSCEVWDNLRHKPDVPRHPSMFGHKRAPRNLILKGQDIMNSNTQQSDRTEGAVTGRVNPARDHTPPDARGPSSGCPSRGRRYGGE